MRLVINNLQASAIIMCVGCAHASPSVEPYVVEPLSNVPRPWCGEAVQCDCLVCLDEPGERERLGLPKARCERIGRQTCERKETR